jgi:hypothetical protein
MDLFQLKLELINFSKNSPSRWWVRRTFIGFLLFIYYLYAFLFFFMVAFPNADLLGIDIQPQPQELVQLQEGQPESNQNNNHSSEFGKGASKPVQKPVHPLLLMVTFGFIGGVFFITRTFVRTTQKQVGDEVERKDVSVAWYLTRPLQSALMAIFIYYAFRAGQLVFYSMEGAPSEEQINVFTLSLIAIIAGAFTEQAFEKLHSIATDLFKVKQKED